MKRKISHCTAKKMLQKAGIDFRKESYELRMSEMAEVVAVAKIAGYHKRKDAPGSRGRMYFQLLQRTKGC